MKTNTADGATQTSTSGLNPATTQSDEGLVNKKAIASRYGNYCGGHTRRMKHVSMNAEDRSEGFIGKAEVARRLGKSVRTVDAWMRRGVLPYYKPDRSVLFRWSDIEVHIVRNYRSQRSDKPRRNLRRNRSGTSTQQEDAQIGPDRDRDRLERPTATTGMRGKAG
jgi:excisionase family DNA binding protein